MAEYEPIQFLDQPNPLKGNPDAPRLNAANLSKMQTQYAEVLAEVEGGAGPINTALNATIDALDPKAAANLANLEGAR